MQVHNRNYNLYNKLNTPASFHGIPVIKYSHGLVEWKPAFIKFAERLNNLPAGTKLIIEDVKRGSKSELVPNPETYWTYDTFIQFLKEHGSMANFDFDSINTIKQFSTSLTFGKEMTGKLQLDFSNGIDHYKIGSSYGDSSKKFSFMGLVKTFLDFARTKRGLPPVMKP